MSWLAISDGRRASRQPARSVPAAALVTEGSLIVEASFAAEPGSPQILVDLSRSAGWDRGFRMTLHDNGMLFAEHRQNREVTCAILQMRQPDHDAVLRITYSWDGPGRQGYLTAENLDTGRLDQIAFAEPQPWPLDDIAALVGGWECCRTDPWISLIAVSDKVEPVGLATGLVADTLIETATGQRPVQDLVPGDLVLTAERGLQPVRWVLSREVPAQGRFAPIRLGTRFFSFESDLSVAPDHRILIQGADSEYLFGTDAVLVEARHLASVTPLTHRSSAATVTYVQLIFDSHDCVLASGRWVESLYLGGTVDSAPLIETSALSDVPARQLPRHTQIASPLLKPFEAVVLVSAMCA